MSNIIDVWLFISPRIYVDSNRGTISNFTLTNAYDQKSLGSTLQFFVCGPNKKFASFACDLQGSIWCHMRFNHSMIHDQLYKATSNLCLKLLF
jgi:hypothetical protein